MPRETNPEDFFKAVKSHFSTDSGDILLQQVANETFIKRLFMKAKIEDSKINVSMRECLGMITLDLISIDPKQYKAFSNFLKKNNYFFFEDFPKKNPNLQENQLKQISIAIPLDTAYKLLKLVEKLPSSNFYPPPKNTAVRVVADDEDLSESALSLFMPCSLV